MQLCGVMEVVDGCVRGCMRVHVYACMCSNMRTLIQHTHICPPPPPHTHTCMAIHPTVRTPLAELTTLQHTMQTNLQAAQQRITAVETQAATHLAAAHEWEARATGLQQRLGASEKEVETLAAQVALLERRLGRGEYDPSITRVGGFMWVGGWVGGTMGGWVYGWVGAQ